MFRTIVITNAPYQTLFFSLQITWVSECVILFGFVVFLLICHILIKSVNFLSFSLSFEHVNTGRTLFTIRRWYEEVKIQLQLVFNTLQRFWKDVDKDNKPLSVDDSGKITIKRLLGFEDCKLSRFKPADYKKGVIRLKPVEVDV